MKQYGPNPDTLYPNEQIKSICYIKMRLQETISLLAIIPIMMI